MLGKLVIINGKINSLSNKCHTVRFNCYVFQCTSAEKAHTLALAIAKAFYLAYQIIQEQQGKFPSPPERELLFEPQRPDDTTSHPKLPTIQGSEGAPSDGAHPGQIAAEVSDWTLN